MRRCDKCGAVLGPGEDCKDCFLDLNQDQLVREYFDDKYCIG